MLDNMRMHKLQTRTQAGYSRAVRRLTIFLGRSPDTATTKDRPALEAQHRHRIERLGADRAANWHCGGSSRAAADRQDGSAGLPLDGKPAVPSQSVSVLFEAGHAR